MPNVWDKVALKVTQAAQLRQALGYIPGRTPKTASGSGLTYDGSTNSLTLADTAVTPGTYGDSTHVSRVTVDQKGRLTGASAVAIAFPADTGITQLTGDVTAGPGSGSQSATLANSGVSAATYGDATHVAQVALDAKGRATSASNVAITFPPVGVASVTFGVGAPGGTPAEGDLYFDTTLAVYVGYVGHSGAWNQF